MYIEYKEIDELIFDKIVDEFGEWLKKDKQLFVCENSFALAAICCDFPVGFVCVTIRNLDYPLEHSKDAYIEVLGVHEDYRRQGIGQYLIECSEDWARKAEVKQIRTHSNNKAVEAINMWNKLNYGLCPHDYHEFDPKTNEYKNLFSGYWVAKIL